MIVLAALMAAAFNGPDSAPALDAVKTCNRAAMTDLAKAEPHRRTEFAAAAYAEQQAIARERAALLAQQVSEATPAGKASLDLALAQLDVRQRQLDDAHAVESSWRAMFDEMRADYLANCAQTKGGKVQ
ncbi:MAG: hypothetical protein H6916_09920 [Novosphingobium sp.]|uniref:hypothetical protein n=1 Tax=Novosphingobium sp. TaxID=1874826 RepID=UPI001D9B310A|nr:hypothetical protein [Novosphingobium sp.]MCB2058138.1 hypothetical protein [Novosphingobium sp.]MCP5387110.1 hypothetical protein [Novosphingobium sp.]HNJ47317.1 hypothetical protein [Novosphingobium sp.]